MLLITDARQEDRKEKKGNSRSERAAAAAAEATYRSASKDNSNKCACGGVDGGQGQKQVCGLRPLLNVWTGKILPQNNDISMPMRDRR